MPHAHGPRSPHRAGDPTAAQPPAEAPLSLGAAAPSPRRRELVFLGAGLGVGCGRFGAQQPVPGALLGGLLPAAVGCQADEGVQLLALLHPLVRRGGRRSGRRLPLAASSSSFRRRGPRRLRAPTRQLSGAPPLLQALRGAAAAPPPAPRSRVPVPRPRHGSRRRRRGPPLARQQAALPLGGGTRPASPLGWKWCWGVRVRIPPPPGATRRVQSC